MCKANGVKVNDSFVLELIWEDANPMFRFHSKIESQGKGNRRTRKKRACETDLQARTVKKTPRVEKEGRTRVSNRQESCSVSDQVTNVKQSIVDTLNTVREFRADLETRERDLEASLVEIDVGKDFGNQPNSQQ
ncbi:unnamed protein product [Arabis nemorensis]|uniref:Uncharacterized protein n=1 Tax=Arabis nemorensis TaxID=586526 RepID=A0A565CAW2_9BRAS|nr:unnamed protein product [Arabis nemorensis]